MFIKVYVLDIIYKFKIGSWVIYCLYYILIRILEGILRRFNIDDKFWFERVSIFNFLSCELIFD